MSNQQSFYVLCHTLGIDFNGDKMEVLGELMNFSLQCLGAVRLQCEAMQREQRKQHILGLEEKPALRSLEQGFWAVKSSFSSAVKRLLQSIVVSEEPHNLDPSRHVLESFPDDKKLGSSEWLAAHWATLGDPCEHPFSLQPCEDTAPPVPIGNNHNRNNATDATIATTTATATAAAVDTRRFVLDGLGQCVPRCFNECDKEGRSVLHIAARLDSVSLWEAALRNCAKHGGKTVRDANQNGALPLHNTARFCRSFEVYESVRKEFPEAVKATNVSKMLPLHWAAVKNRNVAIVQDLLRRYPESIGMANDEEVFPLHCAGQNTCLEVVKVIFHANPAAVSVPDKVGSLPLHHAASFKDNFDVFKFIYEMNPQALLVQDQVGLTALHYAASQNDSPKLLQFILERFPQAAQLVDRDGWTASDCLLDFIDTRVSEKLLLCLKQLLSANSKTKETPTLMEDTKSRVVLNCCPQLDLPLYKRLNWISRRLIVWVFLRLASDSHKVDVDKQRSALCEFHTLRLLTNEPQSTPKHLHETVLKCTEHDLNRSQAMRRLSRHFMGPEGVGIPLGVLQKIVKMI